MKIKLLSSLGLAAALASSAAGAGVLVTINPDGVPGGDPNLAVQALGWNNANNMAIPVRGTAVGTADGLLQTYGHGALANFNDAQNNAIGGTGLNTAYEWTYVYAFQEFATPVSPFNSNFAVVPGGDNFFQVFYDTARNSSNLTGTGFNDGTLILSGSILPFDVVDGTGAGTFGGTGLANQALDKSGVNNYPAITSVSGIGSATLKGRVLVADVNPAFFPGITQDMIVVFDSFNNIPFTQTDPSGCFWDGTQLIGGAGQNSLGSAPAACLNSIGTENGLTGPNVLFQTRGTNDFNFAAVPEPGVLALFGLSLAALGGISRRRRVS